LDEIFVRELAMTRGESG